MILMKFYSLFIIVNLLAAAAGMEVLARNVDLSTVPERDSVQLTIYNSEDLTLVRETRLVSFKKGVNPLQFSWANTLIDPTSVHLKFLDHAGLLELLDTTFPHDKPQMLYWNVQSERDGEAHIEISYFTSGIRWSADYTAIANPEETALRMESFVRVFNNSGEEYENAQVRLVVGVINLVEKIAELAQMPMGRVGALKKEQSAHFERQALRGFMEMEAMAAPTMAMGASRAVSKPKAIAKEGLSEYFIYTIEGTETIPDGWSKRLRSFEAGAVPIKIQYRYRPREYKDHLVRLYLFSNDKKSKLGTTPLPDGMVRVFRDNGREGLSYLAAHAIKYIPVGDKIELNLGEDPEIIFELIKLKVFRDEIWMRLHGPNVYRKAGDGRLKMHVNSTVAGWDEHAVYTQRIRNYSRKAIDVEVRRSFSGDILFRSGLDPILHDYQTVQYAAKIKPGKKKDLYYEIVQRQQHNAKKNNVELERKTDWGRF